MTIEGYNGWTNYETWNVNLWVTNEEPAYKHMMRLRPFTANSAHNLMLMELFPNGTPDMNNAGDYSLVNWQEVADAWNEDETNWG